MAAASWLPDVATVEQFLSLSPTLPTVFIVLVRVFHISAAVKIAAPVVFPTGTPIPTDAAGGTAQVPVTAPPIP
jgi:hypothetical protein